MNNKYFTPDLEDLFIGYECEINYCIESEKSYWIPTVLDLWTISVICDIKEAGYRTSYLTKEDIEKEGWENTYKNFSDFYFKKENYRLLYDFNDLDLKIFKNVNSDVMFDGKCKSVNEFRKLIKMLEI